MGLGQGIVGSRAFRRLRETAALDLRSLALLRIGLALTLLFDLAQRLPQLAFQYTDAGVLPRELLRSQIERSPLELHDLGGSVGFEGGLFALAGLGAAALGLGLGTRVASALCWLLTLSLQLRNPGLVDSGDRLLSALLFFGLFLPLDARFSLDARRAAGPSGARARPCASQRHLSLAGAALLLQVFLVHFGAGLAKRGVDWRVSGRALEWVLSDSAYVWPAGLALLPHPELLRWLSYGTVALEIGGALLLLAPVATGPLRTLAIAAFLGLHAGIAVTLRVGIFPAVSAAGLLGCVPGWAWERFARVDAPGAASPAEASHGFRILRTSIVGAGLCLVMIQNLATFSGRELPFELQRTAAWLGLHQSWAMYGVARKTELSFEYYGTTASGRSGELRELGRGPAWDAFRAWHDDLRFRIGILNLRSNSGLHELMARGLASWLCRTWNADPPGGDLLVRVDLVAALRPLRRGGGRGEPRRGVVLGDYRCESRDR